MTRISLCPRLKWTSLMLCLALAACSTVRIDYDAGASFASFATYRIERSAADAQALSLDAARIENALTAALHAKHISPSPHEAALIVRYAIEERSRLESTGLGLGFGLGAGRSAFGLANPPDIREVKERRLVVELISTADRKVIWRAIGERTLSEGMAPDKRETLIRKIVTEMFEKYPP